MTEPVVAENPNLAQNDEVAETAKATEEVV